MNYTAILSQMNDCVMLYYHDSGHWLLAVMSYLYLFASSKGIRRKLIWPTALLVFLLMNPILYANDNDAVNLRMILKIFQRVNDELFSVEL